MNVKLSAAPAEPEREGGRGLGELVQEKTAEHKKLMWIKTTQRRKEREGAEVSLQEKLIRQVSS